MENVHLIDLKMSTRTEALAFLKKLWRQEKTPCPICGGELELLHKKAKKSTSDWLCRGCGRVYRTIRLLDELNEQMPD